MHCASCVARVEKVLRTVEGVEQASVNLTTNRAEVDGRGLVADHLIEAVKQAGYDAALVGQVNPESESKKSGVFSRSAAFKRAVITLPLVACVMVLGMWVHSPWSSWTQLVMASLVMAVLGTPFFVSTFKGLPRGRVDMDTLIALGSGVAFGASLVTRFTTSEGTSGGSSGGGVHFGTAVAILWFITLGHALEHKARRSAANALNKLRQLVPETATVIRNGQETKIPISQVPVGALVLIKPGSRVPLDGTVKQGASTVDQSMVTGESDPIEAGINTKVYAGTINQTGSLRINVTATGAQTLLGQIVEMVEQAQGTKAGIQRLADKAAGVFVPVVIVIALGTLLGWGIMQGDGGWARGLNACVAVLVVACPCALGLAVPTAILVGTGVGASRGILIKDPAALERCYGLTHIILDKTGTLTTGRPAVTGLHSIRNDIDSLAMLRLAAAAERDSEHPFAKAILKHAQQRGIDIPPASGFQSKTAEGVVASVEGQVVKIGRLSALREQGVVVPKALEKDRDAQALRARTIVAVAVNNEAVGLIGLADEIRPEAPSVVKCLKKIGLCTIMMTGDLQYAADHVARELSIDRTFAEVKPADKRQEILDLQASSKSVVMVGDGINDAPALAEADLGIAIGGGTDIARDAGHIVLVGNDITQLPAAIKLGRATMRRIVAGLLWASIYNICLIPYAASGFMPPMAAAIAMSLSSVSVVLNALWLRWTWRG